MSILEQICARKRLHIEEQKIKAPLADLKNAIKKMPEPRGFIKAIQKTKGPAIIAEIKKASPAHGVIRSNFDARGIGKIYQDSGAACLSILTDEPYFQGKDSYLSDTYELTNIPILRKDFMLDEYQIYESRALGADCILLIMGALESTQAKKLCALAEKLGMDVLVEIHDEAELAQALKLEPAMIGINNRNLKTLKVDIDTSFQLAPKIPKGILKISESGISDRPTIDSLIKVGFDGFLIGEGLMRQVDIGAGLRELTART